MGFTALTSKSTKALHIFTANNDQFKKGQHINMFGRNGFLYYSTINMAT